MLEIIELIAHIDRQIGNLTRDQFFEDLDVQEATAYRLLAIGEAAKSIDDEIKGRHRHIPWREILGMRNILAHEYFIRESEIIWETVKSGFPELLGACRSELMRLGWRPDPP